MARLPHAVTVTPHAWAVPPPACVGRAPARVRGPCPRPRGPCPRPREPGGYLLASAQELSSPKSSGRGPARQRRLYLDHACPQLYIPGDFLRIRAPLVSSLSFMPGLIRCGPISGSPLRAVPVRGRPSSATGDRRSTRASWCPPAGSHVGAAVGNVAG